MLYVIQLDNNVFEDENGQWFFVKRKATSHYNKIMEELLRHIYKGNLKEQRLAKKIIANFRMLPLRMH